PVGHLREPLPLLVGVDRVGADQHVDGLARAAGFLISVAARLQGAGYQDRAGQRGEDSSHCGPPGFPSTQQSINVDWQSFAKICRRAFPGRVLRAWLVGMQARRAVTITDVAAATGVAPSTVSRALHNPGRVSAATRARVEEAARRLNYIPNSQA